MTDKTVQNLVERVVELGEQQVELSQVYAEVLGRHNSTAQRMDEVEHIYNAKKAELVAGGVEGKNAQERQARIDLILAEDAQVIHELDQELSAARTHLDIVSENLKATRYLLRAMQSALDAVTATYKE